MIRLKLLILVAVVVCGSQPSSAQSFNVSANLMLLFKLYSGKAVSVAGAQNSWALYSQTRIHADHGPISSNLQFDANEFDAGRSELTLQKWAIDYDTRNFSAGLGDSHPSYGRGITLSVRPRQDSLGSEDQSDSSLLGIHARYSSDNAAMEAVGGAFHDQLGRGDHIFGIDGHARPFRILDLGATGVYVDGKSGLQDYGLLGVRSSLSLGAAGNVYSEVASLKNPGDDNAAGGHSLYIESRQNVYGVSLTGEYARYRNFLFPYSHPPLLEDTFNDMIADFFAIYQEDLRSFRIRADYPIGRMILSGGFAKHDERASERPQYPRYARRIDHTFVELEYGWDSGLNARLAVGRRNETGEGYYFQFTGPTTILNSKLVVPLFRRFGAEVSYFHSGLDGKHVQFQRNRLAVGIADSRYWSMTGFWESSNLPGELSGSQQTNYFYGQAELKLNQHAVRFLWGQTRGGLHCSGGVCQYVAAFQGVRMESILRFP